MHVVITGASGFIASSVIPRLIERGHTISALVRSDEAAIKVTAFGPAVTVVQGTLTDLDVLCREAVHADGVIHLGFVHDFANYAASVAINEAATTAMCDALVSTGKPKVFLGTSGLLGFSGQGLATEDSIAAGPRAPAERLVLSYATQGLRTAVLRLATSCHGPGDRAFVPIIRDGALKSGYVAVVGDGTNHWPACHKDDVGELYALALEKAQPGAVYHAAAENVPLEDIASALGKGLGLPSKSVTEASPADYGFVARLMGLDCVVSNDRTRKELGWEPKGITLLEDIAQGDYFGSRAAVEAQKAVRAFVSIGL